MSEHKHDLPLFSEAMGINDARWSEIGKLARHIEIDSKDSADFCRKLASYIDLTREEVAALAFCEAIRILEAEVTTR